MTARSYEYGKISNYLGGCSSNALEGPGECVTRIVAAVSNEVALRIGAWNEDIRVAVSCPASERACSSLHWESHLPAKTHQS